MDIQQYQIIWSLEAYEDYQNIINFLSKNWNERVLIQFVESTENKLRTLTNQPFIGLPSQKNALIRSILLSPQKPVILPNWSKNN